MSNVIAGCFTKTKIVLFVVISESHSLLQCGKVSNVKSRIKTLRKSSRCFLCLNRENVFKNCTLSCICQKCDRKPHTSICSKLKKNQEKDEYSVKSTDDVVAHVGALKCTLLQIAKGKTMRALFNTGSQRIYLTENLRKHLKLETTRNLKHLMLFNLKSNIVIKASISLLKHCVIQLFANLKKSRNCIC